MFGRSKHGWIGLDIGANCIKLAQVVRHGTALHLAEAAIVPRVNPWQEDNLVGASPISAADEVSAALVTSPEVSGRQSAAVLSATTCQINTARAVEGGTSQQLSAIVDELATLGVSLQGRVFDYWPALASKQGKNSVHILSTTQAWSDATVSDLQQSGLSCQAIDGLPHALARAINLVQPASANTIGALDWSYTGATFVLIDQGQPTYVRQLHNCALATALEAVSTELGIEPHEARDLLQTVDLAPRIVGSRDEVSEVVDEIIEPVVNVLIDELQRTLEHLHNIGKQLTPRRLFLAPESLYLFGGGGTIGGLDMLLSHRLHRKVRIWKLNDDAEALADNKGTPLSMLGPAIALSALRWEAA